LRIGGDDGKPNFSDEFKRDAVAQITERGYPVAEVSQRLGVSQHSLYAWKRQLARQVSGDAGKDAEIRQLKRELARVTEERDILTGCGKRRRSGHRRSAFEGGGLVCRSFQGEIQRYRPRWRGRGDVSDTIRPRPEVLAV
jgi:transposase